MVAKPIDAARWLIAVAQDSGRPLTNFKVQKLLYYAHGEYLSRYGKPLFRAGFEAWEHGPVCPPVYRAFSDYGSGPIANVRVDLPRLATKIAANELAVLEQAWTDYGDWSVAELWDDVHRPESPWERVYVPGTDHIEISDQEIENYFTDLQSPKIRRSMNRLRKRRDERGEPARQAVGDAGIVQEIGAWDDLRSASSIGLLG
ncbi:Panacea domain-containing protein [Mycobacterium sp. BMJ-28]